MAISILIVDNEEIVRDILFRLVSRSLPNAILHVTAKFELALYLCATFKVDILITTTSMPPNSSNDMLEAVRGIEYNPVKIIIMTSSGDENVLDKLSNIPNTFIIQKPINMNELIDLINEKVTEIEIGRLGQSGSTS